MTFLEEFKKCRRKLQTAASIAMVCVWVVYEESVCLPHSLKADIIRLGSLVCSACGKGHLTASQHNGWKVKEMAPGREGQVQAHFVTAGSSLCETSVKPPEGGDSWLNHFLLGPDPQSFHMAIVESKLPSHEALGDVSNHVQLIAIMGWWGREEKAPISGKSLGELRSQRKT